jgi:hypothetical protein
VHGPFNAERCGSAFPMGVAATFSAFLTDENLPFAHVGT